ncbi:sulfur carrier protein ThiS [Actinocorallia longicatena]|uniref:Sulfur carrier protein ThiS n=1 Tax=Actinocorallia longicatena TaxID=111803 RepID=A0ABP6QAS4_9ACTN
MKVIVNGSATELPEDSTLEAVVAGVTTAGRGVAVAVNDEVVPRTAWATTPAAEGDRVEILTAVQGG